MSDHEHIWKQTGPDDVACRVCGIEPRHLHGEQQSFFNAPAARAARDDGKQRAIDHAPDSWVLAGRDALHHVCRMRPKFTTDQIWERLDTLDVDPPHEPRAMVGVVNYGKRQKWLMFSDPALYLPSKRAQAHAGPKRVYWSLL